MSNKYKIGEEAKLELYRAFFEKMIDEGFSPEYIGEELALVAYVLFTSTEH